MFDLFFLFCVLFFIFPVCRSVDAGTNFLQKEIDILKAKDHWKKAYFYLWDEVLLPFCHDFD